MLYYKYILRRCKGVAIFFSFVILTLRGSPNPFLATVLILYTLETPENQRFSDAFKDFLMFSGGIKWKHCPKNVLKQRNLHQIIAFGKYVYLRQVSMIMPTYN